MRYPDPLSWKVALGLALWMVGVWLTSLAHPSTLETSFLGSSTKAVGVGSQFYQGDTAYIHFCVRSPSAGKRVVAVTWYRNGKQYKKSSITTSKTWHYSSVSVRTLYGEWTVVLLDSYGIRRSHHFVVRRVP